MKTLLKTTVLVLVMLSTVLVKGTKFYDPTYGGHRLDWCKSWFNCGEAAAHAFFAKKRASAMLPRGPKMKMLASLALSY